MKTKKVSKVIHYGVMVEWGSAWQEKAGTALLESTILAIKEHLEVRHKKNKFSFFKL